MADDVEPDFASALGLSMSPVVPVSPGAQLVPVAADAQLVPAGGAGAGQLVPVANAPQSAVIAPIRRHRQTHGNFANVLSLRSATEKKSFSSLGNTVRWARHREARLQAFQRLAFWILINCDAALV